MTQAMSLDDDWLRKFRKLALNTPASDLYRNQINILLCGPPLHGKSSTGNSILGSEQFAVSSDGDPETTTVQLKSTMYEQYKVKVVDCPPAKKEKPTNTSNVLELCGSLMPILLKLCPKGFHAAVIVIQYGCRYYEEEVFVMAMLKEMFGERFIQDHCICVITNGDMLSKVMGRPGSQISPQDLNHWCRSQDPTSVLGRIFRACEHRCVLFDNCTNDINIKKEQVRQLMSMIVDSWDTTYLQSVVSVNPNMGIKADIHIMIETASSLDEYQNQLKFVVNYTACFKISPDTAQVCVMIFGENDHVRFDFSAIKSHEQLAETLQRAPFLEKSSGTDKALTMARQESFSESGSTRYGVQQMALMLTDGHSTDERKTIEEADKLKRSGAEIIVVGAGSVDRKTLEAIASEPTSVYIADTYDELEDLPKEVAQKTAEKEIPTMNQAMAMVVDDRLSKFRKLALNTPASDLSRNQINILLCGPPWHGKSSTGNSILGSAQFVVSSDGDTETTTVQLKSTMYEQYKVKVVDCPPALKEKPTNAKKVLKLCGSMMPILLKLCPKGFHSAVIVLQYGRHFYEEEEFVMAMLKEMFGERFIQDHCICVITNGDMYRKVKGRSGSQISPQDFNHWCRSQDPTSVLGRIFGACKYRCVLFDNCTNDMTIKKKQVRQLMSMIVASWPTTNLLSVVSVNPNMGIKADIHIMIETASSFDEYQSQLKFVVNYTACLKISPDTAQVCVMIFGENDHVRFDFSAIKSHEQLAETLQRAPFLKKSSGTDRALTLALQESFSESGSTRYGVQQMALMLTDGHSTDDRKTIEEADKLKSSGAEIIVVGAGSVDRKTLEAIASEPTSVYIADTYDELEDLPKEVAQKTAEKEILTMNQAMSMVVDDMLSKFRKLALNTPASDLSRNQINILLCGPPLHGKSSTGNSILGSAQFAVSSDDDTETTTVQLKSALYEKYKVKVVDCPPALKEKPTNAKKVLELCGSVMPILLKLCPKGFHAAVIVLQFGSRFYEEEEFVMAMLKEMFGERFIQDHCICVITNGDMFRKEMGRSEPQISRKHFNLWCRSQGPTSVLGRIFRACKYRCVLFDNCTNDMTIKKEQVRQLMSMIVDSWPTTNLLSVVSVNPNMRIKADIHIMIETASSLDEYQSQLKFVVNYTACLKISPDTAQVCVMIFGENDHVRFDFSAIKNHEQLAETLQRAPYLKKSSGTDKALTLARQESFSESGRTRQGVQQMALMLTDGHSTDERKTIEEADKLKSSGTEIIVVWAGSVDRKTLEAIASEPTSVYIADTYDELEDLPKEVAQKTAEKEIPTMNQAMAPVDDWLNKSRKLALKTPASDLSRNQINILLCGPPLHGKSSTGNSILGSEQFAVSSDGDTETTTVQIKSAMYEQYKVKVVDCPPAPKEKPSNARKVLELCGSVMPILLKLCPKGFHAAVIVLQFGRLYYEQEEFVMAMLKEMFGERFIQDHCICVITNGDVLRKVMRRSGSQISLQDLNHWCRSQDPTSVLGRIFRACKYRCVLFDNCTNDMTIKKEQVRQLMSMIIDSWPTTNLSAVSVNPNMRIKADIHIMIETASSFDEYQSQLKFVTNYTSCYEISPDTAQVCVMIIGKNDHVRLDFSSIKSHEQLAEALQRAPFLKKSSGTDRALTLALQESFSESGSTRYGVQQMAIMLTDGHSADERKTIEEADKLKSSGAEIIVVGAGSVDRKTLEAIASEPTSVYIADTYDELEDLPKEVAHKTVEKEIPTMNQAMALVVDDKLNKFRKLALNTPASDLSRNQINILLCGPPLHGKSSTGNSILGSEQFAVSSDGDTETTTVQLKSAMYEKYKVKVVDCPPALKEKPTNARKVLELCGSLMPILLKLCPTGFHAAVIVLQYGSLFYEEEAFVMAMLKEMFGEKFIQDHCICVITNGDMLRKEMGRSGSQISPQDLNHWYRSQDPTSVLGRIFRACEYRCVLFDNCTNDMTIKKEQVRQLMSMIVDSWPTTTLLSVVSVNPNMRIKADIHIMIETASHEDEYQSQLKFVANYTSCYKISPDTAQVCLMIFGENDHVRFNFSEIKTHEQLTETLQRAPFLKKSSGTDKALTLARQESFSESGSTRFGVQQMALMLTDGHSTDERKTIEEADKLKSSGAEIIVVGAGSVDRKTLEAIASEPTSVYIADTYDELEDLPKEVAQKTAEKAPEFKSKADILFILDSSGSISSEDYQKELDFVVYLTECFNIGRHDVLFSVMVFSSDCEMLFDFTLANHQQVTMQIKAAPHMQNRTDTAAALDLARTEAFTRRCGCRGGKKIAIIITDGCSNDMDETARAAEQLIDSDVLTLAVGVGDVNRDELECIAILPEDVYMVDNYSVLQTIRDELANKTCKLETAQRNKRKETTITRS